ncbi:MAG: hypothetical protein LQ345_005376 [Seirophora villosa]|nr:MAG: hypothetical protein LQ345_005376 [Seirophora villosa]
MAKSSKPRPPKRPPPPTMTTTPSSPFTPPSSSLSHLLSSFPHPHIYILHLDPTTPQHRALLFAFSFLLNALLAALLLYRLSHALPLYISLLTSNNSTTASPPLDLRATGTQHRAMAALILRRTAMLFFDLVVLGRWVAEWPVAFFLGGAVAWRWRVGFPPPRREVVVRRSRRWAERTRGREWWRRVHDVVSSHGAQGREDEEEEESAAAVAWDKIAEATRRESVKGKSGMLLVGTDWELCFRAMVRAHSLLLLLLGREHRLEWSEFERGGPVVAVWSEGQAGWLVWRPWGDDDDAETDEKGKGEKLRLFKGLLTRMGREGLFFRWVEMMQRYGGAAEAGFTRERREMAVGRSRALFEGEGVSWEEVMRGIGGVDGLPGMEVVE